MNSLYRSTWLITGIIFSQFLFAQVRIDSSTELKVTAKVCDVIIPEEAVAQTRIVSRSCNVITECIKNTVNGIYSREKCLAMLKARVKSNDMLLVSQSFDELFNVIESLDADVRNNLKVNQLKLDLAEKKDAKFDVALTLNITYKKNPTILVLDSIKAIASSFLFYILIQLLSESLSKSNLEVLDDITENIPGKLQELSISIKECA